MDKSDYFEYKCAHHPHSALPFDIDMIEAKSFGECIRPHWHDQMEILYIREGSCSVSINGCRKALSRGAVIPIMPGELHSVFSRGRGIIRLEIFCFSLDLLESRTPDTWLTKNIIMPLRCRTFIMPRPILPGTHLHGLISGPLECASLAVRHMYPGYSLALRSSLFSVIRALYIGQNDMTCDSYRDGGAELELMLNYISEHYSEKIGLDEAACALGYSVSYFAKKFKYYTGMHFITYLNEYRLRQAAYRIQNTNETPDITAALCGFDTYSYFSKLFKKRYGVTPYEFKKMYHARG